MQWAVEGNLPRLHLDTPTSFKLGEGEDRKRVRTYGVQVNLRQWKGGDWGVVCLDDKLQRYCLYRFLIFSQGFATSYLFLSCMLLGHCQQHMTIKLLD